MSNKKADISQIRKYLNGELDATTMHKLEREALDDPFLMDALEGYETTGKDQQTNLRQLDERLQQRTAEKKGRIISWKVWSIAASVVVVLTIGGLWLKKSPPAEKSRNITFADKPVVEPKDTVKNPVATEAPLIAQNIKPAPVLKPADKSVDKLAAKTVYQQEISAADSNTPVPTSTAVIANAPVAMKEVKVQQDEKKDNTPLNEVVVMNYASKSKKDTTGNGGIALNRSRVSTSSQSLLPVKVSGLSVLSSKDSKTQFGFGKIAGTIISQDDGSPIIGAAIRVKGTNRSTVTDVNGKFGFSAPGSNPTLDIAYIGYERKEVSVKTGDSLKVALKVDQNALSEVITTGYGTLKKNNDGDEPAIENAHPQVSWSDFKKYLQANAFLADGTSGSVSVEFTVNTDGSLSDFKIKKSFNLTANQKSIDLIKNGPSWFANSGHKSEQVTVKIKFQQQK